MALTAHGWRRVGAPIAFRTLLAASSALIAAAPALAQTSAPAPAPQAVSGAQVYTPADFARFAPRNALDMLRQTPGFSLREASQERGLGQATANVLINGQRVSAKSNDLATELSRIPAQNVVEIRIVDGATLDIPGLSGQVADIIVQARTRISGQFSWRPEFRAQTTDPLLSRGDISVTGSRGPLTWTLALQNSSSRSGADGPTWIYGPTGALAEIRDEIWTGSNEGPQLSGRLAYRGPGGDIGNLSATYRQSHYDYREEGFRDRVSGVDVSRRVWVDDDTEGHEISGDYEFALGEGRLKLIGLNRLTRNPSSQDVLSQYSDGSPDQGNQTFSDYETGETIGRAEYRWAALGGDWQVSGEGAFNSLEGATRFSTLTSTGTYVEIPLPGSDVRVEEDRYEAMTSYSRTLSPSLSIQLAAGGEYSAISLVGANGETRRFWRPKGLASAAWKPDADTTLNARLQRRVGQLDFGVFAASVDLAVGQANAANTQLVPQQVWEVELEGIRRLGPWGVTSLRAYGRSIEDIIDFIPIGATGQAPGNLDQATVAGAEWKGNFTLDPMGWRGVRLDLRVQVQDSHVDDPLTGQDREISNSLLRLYEAVFRHDVPDTDWAWGWNASSVTYARSVRLTEIGRLTEGPVWASIFVEHKDVAGLTVRFTAGNVADARSVWDRTIHANRRDGPVAFFEQRDRLIGPIFTLSVRGRF